MIQKKIKQNEINDGAAKASVSQHIDEIAKEKRERANEFLRRMNEMMEELNCVIDISTVLTSTPGAVPVTHQINVRALDW